jgi:hypothetical protein
MKTFTIEEISVLEKEYKEYLKKSVDRGLEKTKLIEQWLYFKPYHGEVNVKDFTKFLKQWFETLPIHSFNMHLLFSSKKNGNVAELSFDSEQNVLDEIKKLLEQDKTDFKDITEKTLIPLEKDMNDYFSTYDFAKNDKDEFLSDVNGRYGDTITKLLFINRIIKQHYQN